MTAEPFGSRRRPPGKLEDGGVKVEEDDGFEESYAPLHKRSRLVAASASASGSASVASSAPPQDAYCSVLDEPSPLGLRLKKSPSLLDLIQMKLAQASRSGVISAGDNDSAEPSESSRKKEPKSVSTGATERLKASNFPANVLKIGTWEYVAKFEGELVAKCYFAKHKLVWEVLDDGLKSKIEIQWSDITALKANCPENGIGTLDVLLARPPLFFNETDPQPRKHTIWHATSDFTHGQASMHRRHHLQCPSGLLSKNFEKLIQCDLRLYQLSQQPEIELESPVFDPRFLSLKDPTEPSNCHAISDLKINHMPAISGLAESGPSHAALMKAENSEMKNAVPSTLAVPHQPFTSAPGVLQTQTVGANASSRAPPPPPMSINWMTQLKVPGLHSSMSVDDLVNHLGQCISQQMNSSNPPFAGNNVPTKETLEGIAQFLLSDQPGQPSADEKSVMARIDSFCCLLQKDGTPQEPPTLPRVLEQNPSSSEASADSDASLEFTSAAPPKCADNGAGAGPNAPSISRKDSFGDLLMNLPRIASFPQFLFNIPEDDHF